MAQGPRLSVVDYAAWEKGYMPPSEHILIDELSYRGARVILSSSLDKDSVMWLVHKGGPLTRKQRKFMLEIFRVWFEPEDEPEATTPAPIVPEPTP